MMAPTKSAKNTCDINSMRILATIGRSVKVVAFLQKQPIFAPGDAAGVVFFIQNGTVRLTIVSKFGKEATLGILSGGEFFGEGGLAGQPLRMGSATAISDCELLQIDKKAMILALKKERALSDLFVMYPLAHNIQYHEALVDQLFDSGEKRLARVLLLLAHFGERGAPETVIPKVSHEALADLAGTSRVRVGSLMKKFSKSGYVAVRKSGLQIHNSLLNVVLRD